jgi:integrase/recombinase XerD
MTSLRQRMIEDMQVRNLSPHTQAAYVQQVSLFARHFHQSPQTLGPEQIRTYQLYLTNERKLAPSSILQAVGALRFLYKVTLHRDWRWEDLIGVTGDVLWFASRFLREVIDMGGAG